MSLDFLGKIIFHQDQKIHYFDELSNVFIAHKYSDKNDKADSWNVITANSAIDWPLLEKKTLSEWTKKSLILLNDNFTFNNKQSLYQKK